MAIARYEESCSVLIARAFCKSRRLASGVMEPEELLSEALAKTLRREKKWNKQISMVRQVRIRRAFMT